MINFYNQADNLLYKQPNSQFITQDRFRGNFTPNPQGIEEVTETFGIPATTVFQNSGGGNGGGNFITNYDTGRNYQPGGKYEGHPLMSGALQERYNNDGNVVPNYNYGATGETAPHPSNEMGAVNTRSFTPLELSYMSELPSDYNGQPLSRMDKINMMARKFKGVDSAYGDYRTRGKLGNYMDTGIGMVPWLNQGITSVADMLGLQVGGDKSDRQRWAVNNAGFGQYTGMDQFGVFTGGKTMFGKTADYLERMRAKVKDIKENNPDTTNSTLKAQLKDYNKKIALLEDEEKVKGYEEHARRVDLARIQKALGIKKGTPTFINRGDGITTGATTTGGGQNLSGLTTQGGGQGIASEGVASGAVDPAGMGGGSQQATSAGSQKTDRKDRGWGWREGGRIGYFFGGLAARGMKR